MSKKKLGSNKAFCTAYKTAGKQEKNKKAKAARHLKRMAKQTARVLERYETGKSLPTETAKRIKDRIGPYKNSTFADLVGSLPRATDDGVVYDEHS